MRCLRLCLSYPAVLVFSVKTIETDAIIKKDVATVAGKVKAVVAITDIITGIIMAVTVNVVVVREATATKGKIILCEEKPADMLVSIGQAFRI